jgi:hypothetical protein
VLRGAGRRAGRLSAGRAGGSLGWSSTTPTSSSTAALAPWVSSPRSSTRRCALWLRPHPLQVRPAARLSSALCLICPTHRVPLGPEVLRPASADAGHRLGQLGQHHGEGQDGVRQRGQVRPVQGVSAPVGTPLAHDRRGSAGSAALSRRARGRNGIVMKRGQEQPLAAARVAAPLPALACTGRARAPKWRPSRAASAQISAQPRCGHGVRRENSWRGRQLGGAAHSEAGPILDPFSEISEADQTPLE